MNIGLTGGIGSGKSEAAKLFEERGFFTIDADIIARKASAKNGIAYGDIIAAFGQGIVDDDGEIDRKALGRIIFNDDIKRKTLESILHPAIKKLERKTIGEIKGRNKNPLIITHAALMIESGGYKDYDKVILIYTTPDKQIERVMARDNITQEEASKIIRTQMPYEEKFPHAGIIIDNSSDRANLTAEVERTAELLKIFAKVR